MKNFLERSYPMGYNYKTELKVLLTMLAAGVLISFFRFISAYSLEILALYINRGAELILDESRVMPDFVYILGDKLLILLILAAFTFVLASCIHYAYHRYGSKSIYLMRRLPNRFELHRRCLSIPLIFSFIILLAAALLLLICYSIYTISTPEACLTPNQWQKIWR